MKYFILGIVFTLACLALTYWLYLRISSGDELQSIASPDGKYIAEYRVYHQSSATTTDAKTIEIRTPTNPFRHNLLDALDYGADLSLEWTDSRNLIVKCSPDGGKLDFYATETSWRDVTIHYDLHGCQIAGAVH